MTFTPSCSTSFLVALMALWGEASDEPVMSSIFFPATM